MAKTGKVNGFNNGPFLPYMQGARIKFTVQFDQPVTVFALVIGGWLPLVITTNHRLLIDRNILAILSQLHTQSSRADLEANKWWLDFLNSSAQVINPTLCALEGSNQSVPSFEEFRDSFDSASKQISTYLPKANLIKYEEIHYKAAYQIIRDLSKRHQAETNFLIRAVPYILERKSDAKIRVTEEKLISLCREQGLSTMSFVLIAVLSCLYEKKDGSEPLIGRNIINPSKDYGHNQAHNAISDLRALEFLIAVSPLSSDKGVAFCTRDKHLAAFWCGLHVSDVVGYENSLTFNTSLDGTLFPRLGQAELTALIKRLKEQ